MFHFLLLLFSLSKSCLTLQPHGLQHPRFPCPSLSPGVCWNSYPLNQWCHTTISSSVTFFSFCLQSFPASGYFPMSQFLRSGGQRIGASASGSVLPVNTEGWFPVGLTLYWLFSQLYCLCYIPSTSNSASYMRVSQNLFVKWMSDLGVVAGQNLGLRPGTEPNPWQWDRGVLTTGPPGKSLTESWLVLLFSSLFMKQNVCTEILYLEVSCGWLTTF